MTDRTCAHPDCNKVLRRVNTTTLCTEHLHTRPYCRCRACTGQAIDRHRPLPPNVRQVMVTPNVGYSMSEGKPVPISLPREPWS